MEILIIVIVVAIIAFILFAKSNKNNENQQSTKNHSPIKPSYIMTAHEKTMFGEIMQAVPECFIFPQVSLGAILRTSSQATRNKFNRKIADFVITDRAFNILAIIELDDKSHDGKEQKDAERDAMLKEAGYKVLRYRVMPNKQQLRNDIIS